MIRLESGRKRTPAVYMIIIIIIIIIMSVCKAHYYNITTHRCRCLWTPLKCQLFRVCDRRHYIYIYIHTAELHKKFKIYRPMPDNIIYL